MEIKTEAGLALSKNSFACGWSKHICTYALAAAVNALAAKEAECIAAEAQILFPTGTDSSGAYALEKAFCKVCQERGIEKQEVVIRRNPLFGLPVVQITAMGLDTGNTVMQEEALRGGPGDELVLVKWIGMEGMLRIADEKGMDLVKISPQAKPPVCKLMDYGKFRFEQGKREKEARKNQHVVEIKEIRMSPGIDVGDFNVKLKNAQKFLTEGNRVKVSVRFRGREMAHTDIGRKLLDKFAEQCAEVASLDKGAKLEGRNMSMFLSPKK